MNHIAAQVRFGARKSVRIVTSIIVGVVLSSQARSAETTVRFGSVGGLTDAGIYLGQELGFFAKQGLKVEARRMASSPALIAAIATDQLDVAGISVTPGLFMAAARGIQLRIVGDKNSARPGFTASQLVVNPKFRGDTLEQTIQNLRGKTIAVSSRDSSSFFNTYLLLKQGGVALSQVKIKELAYPNMVAALSTGAIDASYMIEPFLSEAIHRGLAVDVSNVGDMTGGGAARTNVPIVYSEKFAENTNRADAFMLAYMEGVRVYNDAYAKGIDKEKVIQILAKRANVAPDIVRDSYPAGLDPNQTVNEKTLDEVQEFFVAQGFMPKGVPIDKLVDNSFAKRAVAKLGVYKE